MKRFQKILAMIMCVLVLVGLAAVPAQADVLIDPTATGSIRLTKYNLPDGTAAGISNKGNETTGAAAGVPFGAEPLEDIYFNYTKVKVDNAATGAAILHTDAQGNKYVADGAVTGREKTGIDGKITWTNLGLGIYLLKEEKDTRVPVMVEPFLISIPTTIHNTTGDDTLIYDVYVYPKNTTMFTEKTIIREDGDLTTAMRVNAGDEVTWQIKTSVPSGIYSAVVAEDAKISYKIVDKLDKYLKADVNSVLSVMGYNIDTSTEIPLTKTTHYTVDYKTAAAAGISTTEFSGQLTVTLTAAGRKKLSDESAAVVYTAVKTIVQEGGPSQEINNKGYLQFTNKDGSDFEVGTPEDPYVFYGGIKIIKKDALTGALLPGATFKVSSTDPSLPAGPTYIKDRTTPANDLSVTTDTNGVGLISGLKYGLDNQSDPETATGTKYWLVEVNAPDGYRLIGTPIEVTVQYSSINDGYIVREVPNAKGFILPATGEAGTMIFVAVGMAVIGLAILLIVLPKRKKQSAR